MLIVLKLTVNGSVTFKLDGKINEQARFPDATTIFAQNIGIDLEKVSYASSAGMIQWARWIEALSENQICAELRNIPVPFVDALNSVNLKNKDIRFGSFYAPFICELCGKDFPVLLQVGSHAEAILQKVECAECSGPAAFDDFAETYLSFIRAGAD